MPPIYPMCSKQHMAYSMLTNNGEAINILSDRHDTVDDFLINVLIDNLTKNRKTLIVYKQGDDTTRLLKSLAALGLSKHGLIWSSDYVSDFEPLKRIQSFTSENPPKFDLDSFRKLRNRKEAYEAQLTENTAFLEKNVIGTYSWRRLFRKWCSLDTPLNQHFTKKVSLPEGMPLNEYLYVLGEAEQGFQERFSLLHDLNPFHDDVYVHFIDTDTLLDELESRKSELEEISDLIHTKLNGIRKEFEKENEKIYRESISVLSKMRALLGEIVPEGYDSIKINTKLADNCIDSQRELMGELSDELFNVLSAFEIGDKESGLMNWSKLTVHEVLSLIDNLQDSIDKVDKNSKGNIESRMQRLGPHNIGDEGVVLLFEKFDSFVSDLNDSDLFNQAYTNNALTIYKKLELVTQISRDLHKAVLFCDNHGDYLDWRSTLIEGQRYWILNDLSYTKEPWKSVMLAQILKDALEANMDKKFEQVRAITHDLVSTCDSVAEQQPKFIDATLHYRKGQSLNELKESFPSIFQALQKGDYNDELVKSILSHNSDLFHQFFPIVITTEEFTAEEICPLVMDNFDDVILFGKQENIENGTINILNPSEVGQDNLHSDTVFDFTNTTSNLRLEMMTSLDKSLEMSKLLLGLAEKASLFRMRGVSIVSCVSAEVEELISRQFINQGIKCLHHKTQVPHDIMEGIIDEESKVYLWVENGSIAENVNQDVRWNEKVLKSLESQGVHVIDICSTELFQDADSVMKSIQQTILVGMSQYADTSSYALFS